MTELHDAYKDYEKSRPTYPTQVCSQMAPGILCKHWERKGYMEKYYLRIVRYL